jgi:hypothetical protein
MDADWSVELGHDDPSLEFPWSAPDGTPGLVDLAQHLEAVREIPEAARYPELAWFLLELNGKFSRWLTAKCDVWIENELGEVEDIYDAKLKMCSYVDVVRRDESERFSFEQHEQWVKSATTRLRNIGPHPIACELIVRRCWYRANSSADDEPVPGFYITLYLFGYGNDQAEARARWRGGLTRVSGVLITLAP